MDFLTANTAYNIKTHRMTISPVLGSLQGNFCQFLDFGFNKYFIYFVFLVPTYLAYHIYF